MTIHLSQHSQLLTAVTTQVTPRSIEEHVLGFHGALTEEDIFYDLGSGDGKIMLQVLLATPAKAGKGIEFAAGRESNAQKAKQRMQSVTAQQAEQALAALPMEDRLQCVKQLLQLPRLPAAVTAKAAAPSGALAKGTPQTHNARVEDDDEEDPVAADQDAAGSAEPVAAATPQKASVAPTDAAAAAGAGGAGSGMAQRRTPGSNAKRQLFSPSSTAQEESKADVGIGAEAAAVPPAAAAKLGKAQQVAAEVLVAHLRHAASRFYSVQGDFIVEDFTDATHIFVNNTVFEADLMLRLREKLAAAPSLKALTTLRKVCHRHTKRCEAKGESCGAFQHPPEQGICWPTWCAETTLFKYTPRDK